MLFEFHVSPFFFLLTDDRLHTHSWSRGRGGGERRPRRSKNVSKNVLEVSFVFAASTAGPSYQLGGGEKGTVTKKEGKKSEIKSSTISVDIVTAIRLFLIRLNSFYLSCFFYSFKFSLQFLILGEHSFDNIYRTHYKKQKVISKIISIESQKPWFGTRKNTKQRGT